MAEDAYMARPERRSRRLVNCILLEGRSQGFVMMVMMVMMLMLILMLLMMIGMLMMDNLHFSALRTLLIFGAADFTACCQTDNTICVT